MLAAGKSTCSIFTGLSVVTPGRRSDTSVQSDGPPTTESKQPSVRDEQPDSQRTLRTPQTPDLTYTGEWTSYT